MKKIIAVLMMVVLCLTGCASGGADNPDILLQEQDSAESAQEATKGRTVLVDTDTLKVETEGAKTYITDLTAGKVYVLTKKRVRVRKPSAPAKPGGIHIIQRGGGTSTSIINGLKFVVGGGKIDIYLTDGYTADDVSIIYPD